MSRSAADGPANPRLERVEVVDNRHSFGKFRDVGSIVHVCDDRRPVLDGENDFAPSSVRTRQRDDEVGAEHVDVIARRELRSALSAEREVCLDRELDVCVRVAAGRRWVVVAVGGGGGRDRGRRVRR